MYAKWASRIVTLFDSGTFGGGALSFTTNQYNNDFSSYFNISYDSDNNLVFTGTQTGGQANVILLPNLDFTDFKTVRIYLKNVSFTLPTQIIATVFSIEHPENLVGGYKTCQLACSAPAMATTSPQVLSIDVTNVNQNAAIMLISPDNRYASSGVITKIEIEYE